MPEVLITALAVFLVFSFIHYAGKKKKPFLWAFLSIVIGIGALTAVNLLSGLTGVYIPVTRLSLLVCGIGGLPGTALMVLLSVF